MPTPSISELKRAIEISEQIEQLESELSSLLGQPSGLVKPGTRSVGRPKGGKMSAEARGRIAAAQKARWAKAKGPAAEPKTIAKKKRKMSPEGRARIVAAVKARWAKVKAA